jgi:DNA-binding response OmpR family regulator
MKILATDDDPIILELLSEFLDTIGTHDLTAATCAQDAIALLDAADDEPFDCFLLDIQMPGIDGTALARHIRQMHTYATAPIIMLTAMSEKRYIDTAFAAGATDYVTKPFDLTELRARINLAEHQVLSRRSEHGRAFVSPAAQDASAVLDTIDLHAPLDLHDIDNVISCTAMENYVAQLSRSSLFGSTVFAFALRKPETYCETLSPAEFKFLIEDVAEVISDSLDGHQFLMTYAGSGTYLCITESGWRPEMPRLMDAVNLRLSRAQIRSNSGQELYPRVSAGAAIRLVWKSGDQILNTLNTAQASAEEAAIEFERLKTDFFQIGGSA